MKLPITGATIIRFSYILSMYTGTRAVLNRLRSVFLAEPQTAVLDGEVLRINGTSDVLIRVHPRLPPHPSVGDHRAGMLSVCLVSPGIARSFYALLRMTSHFGCGHVEIAFYENSDTVVVYAIRNIVKANAGRIGCRRLLRNLKLCEDGDELVLLKRLLEALNDCGLQTSFASPEDCVTLSVNDLFVRPAQRATVRAALRKRYSRIWERAEMPSRVLHREVGAEQSVGGRSAGPRFS